MCLCFEYFILVFTVFLATLSIFIGGINAAIYLHKKLLSSVLHAPQTTFYDVTPVGRIVNRFSKDVETLDTDLPSILRAWSACLFGVHNIVAIFVIYNSINVARFII